MLIRVHFQVDLFSVNFFEVVSPFSLFFHLEFRFPVCVYFSKKRQGFAVALHFIPFRSKFVYRHVSSAALQ